MSFNTKMRVVSMLKSFALFTVTLVFGTELMFAGTMMIFIPLTGSEIETEIG